MKKPNPTPPLVFTRADPAALALFDPATKKCVMNCGPHKDDPRSRVERQFLCGDCLTVCKADHQERCSPNIKFIFGSISRIEQQAREDFSAGRPSPYEPSSTEHRIWSLECERLNGRLQALVDFEDAERSALQSVEQSTCRSEGAAKQ
jgi:hypothetical protein